MPHHADAQPGQRRADRAGIVNGRKRYAARILRIVAGQDLHHQGAVLAGPAHRPGVIQRERQWKNPAPAQQPARLARRPPGRLRPALHRSGGEPGPHRPVARQPGRLRKPGSLLRLDRPRNREASAELSRDALLGQTARGGSWGAPPARRPDEARIEEHQGDHVDRVHGERAARLLERARVLAL